MLMASGPVRQIGAALQRAFSHIEGGALPPAPSGAKEARAVLDGAMAAFREPANKAKLTGIIQDIEAAPGARPASGPARAPTRFYAQATRAPSRCRR